MTILKLYKNQTYMTNSEVITWINGHQFMKDSNIEVNKIKFEGTKSGKNRRIVVYFKDHKYSAMVWVNSDFVKLHQSQAVFGVGVGENDKEYWSKNVRLELLQLLWERFWVWLQSVDGVYKSISDMGWNSEMIAMHMIDKGYNRQYLTNSHMFKTSWDIKLNPKILIDKFNEDCNDGLYKYIMTIEYPTDHKIKWMTEEELMNEKFPLGF